LPPPPGVRGELPDDWTAIPAEDDDGLEGSGGAEAFTSAASPAPIGFELGEADGEGGEGGAAASGPSVGVEGTARGTGGEPPAGSAGGSAGLPPAEGAGAAESVEVVAQTQPGAVFPLALRTPRRQSQ